MSTAHSDYESFLESKVLRVSDAGIDVELGSMSPMLFDFQRVIVRWALRKGRAAIFADCGLGKTPMQLEWASHVPGRVLILAPLAVGRQTEREAEKFGMAGVGYSRDPNPSLKIEVTNYEIMDRFDPADYAGIVLDESSILKAYDGKTRTRIIDTFCRTPYRLCCTATPAPNDYMELGNHSEFLGSMSRLEMLSMFFVHDGGETQKWRLKRHAVKDYWRWVCSWAVALRMPSDLGFEDNGFILPPMDVQWHRVETEIGQGSTLFNMPAATLAERISARSVSVKDRAKLAAEIANSTDEQYVVWCNLNTESAAASKMIEGAVEIVGSDTPASKESALLGFVNGDHRVLVTKPSIAGFGINMQNCHNVVFLGLSDSYEQYYQATRRCWRFGQEYPVTVHVISADTEGAVIENVKRKEAEAHDMAKLMVGYMKETSRNELGVETTRTKPTYKHESHSGDGWEMHNADCVDVARMMPDDSVHYSIFSPPFASLYVYSDSERDMGNVKDHEEFFDHFLFIVKELYRILIPGRLVSFHCMNLPTSKARDGIIGLTDFRGQLIRSFTDEGFVYHSEVCIWKDPVTAMQRTKALGLLHKQLKKDSCMSRQGIADYLVTMRKPGDNPEPVSHSSESFPVHVWQEYASPIWTDINPSDTLQFRSARDDEDERHIAPLQLEVIRRAMRLWTNRGDLVFSPFAGIGSEGWVAVQMGRRFIGAELKMSYHRQACGNLARAKQSIGGLFAELS